jgi:hypothetical protein
MIQGAGPRVEESSLRVEGLRLDRDLKTELNKVHTSLPGVSSILTRVMISTFVPGGSRF